MAAYAGELINIVTNGYETAPYEVIQKFENGMEERRYSRQKWVTIESPVQTGERDQRMGDMFRALFGYITGKNEKSQKISMTVPVSTKVVESGGDDKNRTCQMGFFVPKEFQENTPEPTDSRVKIVERDLHVYAITFGGYMNDATERSNLDKLLEFLKSKNISVATDPDTQKPIHYAVGYDAPFKFWNRKNDIWVVAG